jgi:hypothetical protein
MVDHDKGFSHSTLESPTEIRGVYVEEGKNVMVVLLTWKKIKQPGHREEIESGGGTRAGTARLTEGFTLSTQPAIG